MVPTLRISACFPNGHACRRKPALETEQRTCITFASGRWKKTHTLKEARSSHTGWASPRGVLLMGGHGLTTELLTDDGGTTPSFSLGSRSRPPSLQDPRGM